LETRANCVAGISFTSDHTDELAPVEQHGMQASHRHVSEAKATLIDEMDDGGVKSEQAGGMQNVSFLKDCENYLRHKKKKKNSSCW
jgi:hypothetical protein